MYLTMAKANRLTTTTTTSGDRGRLVAG